MSPGMSDRLNSERHRTFVGRVAERALFRSALASDASPFSVLYVYGPGGVGKSSLLREFFGTCEEMGTVVGYVDARNLDPSPDALMGALCSALGLDTAEHPFDALSRGSGRRVVLIDTYETLAPLGAWITETFLPQLPERLLLVLASRNPPEAGWRVDPGWQRIIRPLRLQNLSRDESETYLKRRNVPPDQHHDILDFTHGHPLALSLVAEVFVQRPAGFVMKLDLHGTTDEDRRADPAVGAAWRHLELNAPLRPGEKATLFRFWMAGDTYQGVSAMQSLIFGNIAQHYLTTPGLAFTFFPTAEPDFWAPMFAYVDLGRAREADFEVGGRRYGVYVHDWRVTPPMAWLDLPAQREVATEPLAVPAAASTPLVVLGESDFTAAVREALRDFHRTNSLRTNPLLRSRVVVERAGTGADDGAGIASLRDLLEETSQSLQASPREAKYHRALHRIYLDPAPNQERAAELLGLPFSTYRRHLRAGISKVAEILWQEEIGTR